ncbi:MAG: ribonuclease HII [Ruminococcus sp.]|nr:ribonuclease HII [Ruminococcus sp.]MCM1380888.1 ribonuclease HII [Muribaculaceae bacterium]MCM1478582.1 ribonuclease HII [Muribaculaceae bacterium]
MTLFEYDSAVRNGFPTVCGIDEAGRGPLAGDVYAAAVIFDEGVFIEGLNDSKKLTEKKREQLFDEITAKARAYCVAAATVEEIERLNILQATFLAMERAYEGLGISADVALIDGNRFPALNCEMRTVVKGDGLSASIAAASILAKVSRDRYMTALAEKYPQYRFDKHKGYGTKLHNELILEHGPCPVHRMSFLKKLLKNG